MIINVTINIVRDAIYYIKRTYLYRVQHKNYIYIYIPDTPVGVLEIFIVIKNIWQINYFQCLYMYIYCNGLYRVICVRVQCSYLQVYLH